MHNNGNYDAKSRSSCMVPKNSCIPWNRMGLALIAGLFTFLASVASAGMVVNFILCAMAGWDILYFFGSIALMGGAGRTLGLDY